MIRLLLADDQALVRGALAALLGLEPDLEVVAQVDRGDQVLETVARTAPDVCLLDIEMPGMDGVEAAALLSREHPRVRSLMVTTFGRPGFVRRAMEAGASGFVVKDLPAGELADAIRRVHRGEHVVDPSLAATSLTSGPNPLSERERDLLRLTLEGDTVNDMAGTVHLSPGTVRNYLSSAIAKMHARTRAEAATRARERGWL